MANQEPADSGRRERAGRWNAEPTLAVLAQVKGPLTAYELLERLVPSGITAATTVYRALARLIDEGRVHRVDSLNGYIVCDGCHTRHSAVVFVVCRRCHATEEIAVPGVNEALRERLEDLDFSMAGASIEIKGICATCAQAEHVARAVSGLPVWRFQSSSAAFRRQNGSARAACGRTGAKAPRMPQGSARMPSS